MVAEPQSPVLSADEYLRIEAAAEIRHEFIDGNMYALAGGTTTHGMLSGVLLSTLLTRLRGGPCSPYPSDVKVQLSATRYVYPDVSVTCDKRDRGDRLYISHPTAIIEVPSLSTEAYDRGDKFALYRECSTVQEYLLVSTRRPRIEVYSRAGDTWTMRTFKSTDEVELISLRVSFGLDEVYAGIELAAGAS